MAWVKLDDQWMDHPKIIRAGRDARDMWLASITWCAKHLTDGYFPANLIPQLAVMAGIDVANCQTFATTLLDLCLWDASEDGYMVHDYLDYNPTKEQVLSTREARKEAGRAGGNAKASKLPSKTLAKSYQKSAPSPSPYPEEKEEERVDRSPVLPSDWQSDNSPQMEAQRIMTQVTGLLASPPDELIKYTPIILSIKDKHNGTHIEYLKGFYTDWCSRKTKDGKPYKRTMMGWLEWALEGSSPQAPTPPARRRKPVERD